MHASRALITLGLALFARSAAAAPAEEPADAEVGGAAPADSADLAEGERTTATEADAVDGPAQDDRSAAAGDGDAAAPSPGSAGDEGPGADPLAAPTSEPAASAPAAVPTQEPKHSFYYNNLTVIRLNALGLENRFNLDYRWRIYDGATSRLKQGSHIAFGVEPILNPALTRVSAMLTIQPLAILRLRAAFGLLSIFGTFDFLQSYNTPTAEHYTAQYESTTDSRYSVAGTQAQLAALLQAKVGPIAIRNDFQAFRTDVNLRDADGDGRKDPVFFYIRDDIMLQGHGWHLINDSDVLYVSPKFGLTAGVRATVVKPFYKASSFLDSETGDDPNGPTFRLGPLLAYTFFDRPGKRFNKPTILVISQWWIKHRYRVKGSPLTSSDGTVERGSLGDSLPGMPTLVIGFAFQGQLWGKG